MELFSIRIQRTFQLVSTLYFSREEYKIGETHRYLILTFSERIIAVGAYVYKAASSDEVMWTETKNMGYS